VKKAPSHSYAWGELQQGFEPSTSPFLVLLPGIGNSNSRVIYLSILLTLIFIIAYTLDFLFVSLKVGENIDTKLGLREVHHPLRQDESNMKIHSLVVGANFC
jgi:hypothetical protein